MPSTGLSIKGLLPLIFIGLLQAQNTKPNGGSLRPLSPRTLDLPFVDSLGELWFSRLQPLKISEAARRAPRRLENEPVALPTVISPIAEGVPFESGEPEPLGVRGVQRIVDFSPSSGAVLYLTACGSTRCSGGNLWTFDGLQHSKLHDGVFSAYFHPQSISVVIWTVEHEVLLVHPTDGSVIRRVPGRAAAPIFSQDGTLLAYEKVADPLPDGGTPDLVGFSPGIAVLDLSSGVERLVTHDSRGNDFEPVAFSSDNQLLLLVRQKNSWVSSGSGNFPSE